MRITYDPMVTLTPGLIGTRWLIGSSYFWIIAAFRPSFLTQKLPAPSVEITKCLRLTSGSPDSGISTGFDLDPRPSVVSALKIGTRFCLVPFDQISSLYNSFDRGRTFVLSSPSSGVSGIAWPILAEGTVCGTFGRS